MLTRVKVLAVHDTVHRIESALKVQRKLCRHCQVRLLGNVQHESARDSYQGDATYNNAIASIML